jgi:DNA-binding GntR family transcriptional regulator
LEQEWTPEQQLQLFIERAAGVHIDEAHQQTDATAADYDSARNLDVALGSPILRGYRWYYSGEKVIYCGVYTWPGDRFRLQIVLDSSRQR